MYVIQKARILKYLVTADEHYFFHLCCSASPFDTIIPFVFHSLRFLRFLSTLTWSLLLSVVTKRGIHCTYPRLSCLPGWTAKGRLLHLVTEVNHCRRWMVSHMSRFGDLELVTDSFWWKNPWATDTCVYCSCGVGGICVVSAAWKSECMKYGIEF